MENTVSTTRRVSDSQIYSARKVPVLLRNSRTVWNDRNHHGYAVVRTFLSGENMNRNVFGIVTVIATLVVGATAFAQQHRPYNEIMKDVAATFPNLKKNLDANNGAAAAEDAAKLEKF